MTYAVIPVVVILFLALLANSRLRRRSASEVGKLLFPTFFCVVSVLGFLMLGGLTLALILSGKVTNIPAVVPTIAIGSLAAFGLWYAINAFVVYHIVSDVGLDHGSVFSSRRWVEWSDVRSVRYRPLMKCFQLETQSGKVVRIENQLIGLPEFAALVLEHVPASAIDSQTLEWLRKTAAGELPPV